MEVQVYEESGALKQDDNPYLDLFLQAKKSAGNMDRLFDPELDEETREDMYNAMDCSIAEVCAHIFATCIVLMRLEIFMGNPR